MKIIHAVAVLALVAPLSLLGASPSRAAETMPWPQAVGLIAGERTNAERCIAQLKKYGKKEQIDRGDLSYGRAKADSDAVIAGLIIAVSAGEKTAPVGATPAGLPSLLTKLQSSQSGLKEFCDGVNELIPSKAPGQKDVADEIVKVAIELHQTAVGCGIRTLRQSSQRQGSDARIDPEGAERRKMARIC